MDAGCSLAARLRLGREGRFQERYHWQAAPAPLEEPYLDRCAAGEFEACTVVIEVLRSVDYDDERRATKEVVLAWPFSSDRALVSKR